uniref:Protein brambleberry n=1 Tax=Anopheles dirus TaxID=7168 RepID=A0A182NF98_9DIPT
MSRRNLLYITLLGLCSSAIVAVGTDSNDAAKSRSKRFLIFPRANPQRLQLIGGFGIPADIQLESITMGYVFKSVYYLPWNSSHWIPPFLDRHEFEADAVRRRRASVPTPLLVPPTERKGLNGRSCVLRAICESSEASFTHTSGLIGELLHIAFTPSATEDVVLEPHHELYRLAEKVPESMSAHRGKPSVCADLYAECNLSLLDSFSSVFGGGDAATAIDAFPAVPYELSDGEENFIREASKWIGMNLSKLDMCHHRIILTLKKSCHELNAEQMGKLSVMLLNCQSDSEGRTLFPCTDEMPLRQCTERMDPDTWNAYHLITNRAKAVCASVRHEQFRGLTELTVNKLMRTAHEQVRMMDELAENQQNLQTLTKQAVDEMVGNNERIMSQQGDIMKLSETHRAKIESNFRDLVREKGLIRAGQQEVAVLLTDLRNRIDDSMRQLELQSKRSKLNHDSLLSDLERLQANAAEIAAKIDETGVHFASHHRVAEEQYRYTLEQLARINGTVSNLLESLGKLQHDFNQHLAWLVEKIGGSENILQKLNVILVHFSYLLVGMICLAFVGADNVMRLLFIAAVPGNLIGGLLELFEPDVMRLSIALGCAAVVDLMTRLVVKFVSVRRMSAPVVEERTQQQRTHHANVTADNRARTVEESESEDEDEVLDRRGGGFVRRQSITRERSTGSTVVDSLRRSVSRFGDDFRRRSFSK